MSTSHLSSPSRTSSPDGESDARVPSAASAKKQYETPKLITYGKVGEITQFFDPYHHHHHRWMSDD